MTGINYLAVIVSVVGIMALGAFWYSPAFLGKRWMDAVGIKEEDIDQKAAMRGIIISLFTSLISTLVMAVLMNLFGIDSGKEGLLFGLAIGTGIVAMTQLSNTAYEQDKIWEVFAVSGSYRIVSFLFSAWLLGFWQ